jgi:hypothetical protein
MKHMVDGINEVGEEDGTNGDEFDGALSLADTLEEDQERYQDVIRTLDEFEEGQGAELTAHAEEVSELENGGGTASA